MVQHLLEGGRSGFARLEVIEGPTGRRSWTDEAKGRIVAESFAPGAIVNEVAKRHGLTPQHLTTWRRKARVGELVLPADAVLPDTDGDDDQGSSEGQSETERASQPPVDSPPTTIIELEVSGTILRLPIDTKARRVAELASALKAMR
jgi:transposase